MPVDEGGVNARKPSAHPYTVERTTYCTKIHTHLFPTYRFCRLLSQVRNVREKRSSHLESSRIPMILPGSVSRLPSLTRFAGVGQPPTKCFMRTLAGRGHGALWAIAHAAVFSPIPRTLPERPG